jgi:branched-chain amino acid transport system permease protein
VLAILVVIFAPKGLVGLWRETIDRMMATRAERSIPAKVRIES